MSKAGTSAPPSINPFQLGATQAESNVATAAAQAGLNNVNTASPFGSSTFTPYGQGPNGIGPAGYTLNNNLSPQVQPVFDAQTRLAAALAGNAGGMASFLAGPAQGGADLVNRGFNFQGLPNSAVSTEGLPALATGANAWPIQRGLNFSGLPQLPSSATDFSNEVGNAQKAAYDTQAGYLDPQFSQKHSDLTQQLADQGISPGTVAYSRAQGDLGRQETMAYQQAKDAAVAAGDREQSTLFGENLGARQQGVNEATTQGQFANAGQQQGFGQQLTNAQLANAARNQAFGERTTQFAEPLQALGAYTNAGEGVLGGAVNDTAGLGSLANFAGTGTVPTTIGQTQISPANIVGAGQVGATSANNAFNAGNTLNNQIGGAFGSLGGSLGLGNGGLGNLLGIGGGGSGGLFGMDGLFGPSSVGSIGGDALFTSAAAPSAGGSVLADFLPYLGAAAL